MLQIELDGKLVNATKHQLLALVARGRVGPHTKIVLNGKESTAGKIKGLKFSEKNTTISLVKNKIGPTEENKIHGVVSLTKPEMVVKPLEKNEVYDLASPSGEENPFVSTENVKVDLFTQTPAKENPFALNESVKTNPFTAQTPAGKNPFSAAPSKSDNLFTSVSSETKYFYTDEEGVKRGPLDEKRLQKLVDRGTFTIVTPLETDTGHQIVAAQIPGLMFTNIVPSANQRVSQDDSEPEAVVEGIEDSLWPVIAGIVVLLIVVGGIIIVSNMTQTSNRQQAAPSKNALKIEKQTATDKFIAVYGIDVRKVDEDGYTLLHTAIATDKDNEVAKFLVSKGARVNAKTNNGWTPLHFAASKGNIELVKFLISQDANVNAKSNNGGYTPFEIARAGGHTNVAEYLKSVGGK